MSPQKAGLSKQADVHVCTLMCEELALGAWQTWAQILALLLPTWYCTCLWVYLLRLQKGISFTKVLAP